MYVYWDIALMLMSGYKFHILEMDTHIVEKTLISLPLLKEEVVQFVEIDANLQVTCYLFVLIGSDCFTKH